MALNIPRVYIGNATGYASWFLNAGLARARKILEAAKRTQLPDDDRRCRIQTLMRAMKDRLETSKRFKGLTLHRWSDQSKEQLFATGPARSAYVGLYISYDASEFPSADTIRAVGDISLDVARKHRRRLRGVIADKSREQWAAALGIPS